jgi:hypothetical protein
MGALAAVVEREVREAETPMCKFGSLFFDLDAEDQAALEYAVGLVRDTQDSDPHKRVFTQAWLVKLLNDNGYQIGKTVVADHLRGRCACVARK